MSLELASTKEQLDAARAGRRFDYLTTVMITRGGQNIMMHVTDLFSRSEEDTATSVLMRVNRIFGVPDDIHAADRMIRSIKINDRDFTSWTCMTTIRPGDIVAIDFK